MIKYYSNGQWTLQKSAVPKESPGIQQPSIHDLIGKTHTVEVHPHVDHLHNIKGAIKESGKPHMSIGEIKKKGFSSKIVDSLPRDAKGKVTHEMIDKHIEGLPKHKVQIKVAPYKLKMQQHRDGVPQYVVSVGLHPENKLKADPAISNTWNNIRTNQHELDGHEDQIGWARVDPFKVDNGNIITPNDKHWHVDEIQSDFHQPDAIKDKHNDGHIVDQALQHPELRGLQEASAEASKEWSNHPDYKRRENNDYGTPESYQDWKERVENHPAKIKHDAAADKYYKKYEKMRAQLKEEDDKKPKASPEEMHDYLSHGHDDPNHLIHSAVNELARKHGIESMSMDTPEDQAEQSGLQEHEFHNHEIDWDRLKSDTDEWFDSKNFNEDKVAKDLASEKYSGNHYLKSALNKIPHDELKNAMRHSFDRSEPAEAVIEDLRHAKLAGPEKDALQEYLNEFYRDAPDANDSKYAEEPEQEEAEKKPVPVHQLNTYDKRPKALGMKPEKKSKILGAHPDESVEHSSVQYMKLHKKLRYLSTLLKTLGKHHV